jgi:pilus assembly protein CpaB
VRRALREWFEMKPKTFILLCVAMGCGLMAMLGVQQAIQGQSAPKVETERVLVALQNIDTGNRLTAENVGFREMPVGSLPEDPVRTEEEYLERAASVPLIAGDILRMSKLTEKGGFGKSMSIPHGMRVITIAVNDTHTASGLLKPGDRVDLLVTFRSTNARGSGVSKTKTLLEYVEVFATNDMTANRLQENKEVNNTRFVSLLLPSPEQVQYVKLAESKGTLSLSWRNRLDDEVVQTQDIDEKLLEELQGMPGRREAPPLYDSGIGERFVDHEEPKREPQAAADFLDTLQEPTPPPAPQAETWTVMVYNGSDPLVQEYDIPLVTETVETTASEQTVTPSLSEMVRSLWKRGGQDASAERQPDENTVEDEPFGSLP